MRLNGASYSELAAAGGGIQSTVNATRAASFDGLLELAEKRLDVMKADGVTTVEIKSGYGLEKEAERKSLEVVRALKKKGGMDISPTFLAAHSVPPEYAGRAGDYMDVVCGEWLPEFFGAGLFDAADVFLENIAFGRGEAEKLFKAAAALGIPVKAHNEQLSNIGGSALLASYGGLSSDHLERLDEAGVKALAASGTVAVLLPGAYYFLRDTQPPPVAHLTQYNVPIAVATDYNPGTSPFASLRQALNMASTLFGLTPQETLSGVTANAAKALGREKICGALAPGFRADFAVWKVGRPVEIFYELGPTPLVMRVFDGVADTGTV
jgi:imidazolonepropionase